MIKFVVDWSIINGNNRLQEDLNATLDIHENIQDRNQHFDFKNLFCSQQLKSILSRSVLTLSNSYFSTIYHGNLCVHIPNSSLQSSTKFILSKFNTWKQQIVFSWLSNKDDFLTYGGNVMKIISVVLYQKNPKLSSYYVLLGKSRYLLIDI